jgi:hypothetical protein
MSNSKKMTAGGMVPDWNDEMKHHKSFAGGAKQPIG